MQPIKSLTINYLMQQYISLVKKNTEIKVNKQNVCRAYEPKMKRWHIPQKAHI